MDAQRAYQELLKTQTLPPEAQKYANAAAPPPNPTVTMEMYQMIEAIRSNLQEVGADLSMLSDRLFGPEGSSAQETPSATTNFAGTAGDLILQLESLRRFSLNLSSVARGLNGRI